MTAAARRRRPSRSSRCDDLSKRFGGVAAVDGCSFSVRQGTITGADRAERIGQDHGLQPDHRLPAARTRGSCASTGRLIRRPDPTRLYRRGLSRTFQQARVFPQLTLIENLVVAVAPAASRHGAARRSGREDRARAEELLSEFGLARPRGSQGLRALVRAAQAARVRDRADGAADASSCSTSPPPG